MRTFAEELKAAKRSTNFLFYKSMLPFDISNIPASQFQQLKDYFQSSILRTLIKRTEARGSQTDAVQLSTVTKKDGSDEQSITDSLLFIAPRRHTVPVNSFQVVKQSAEEILADQEREKEEAKARRGKGLDLNRLA